MPGPGCARTARLRRRSGAVYGLCVVLIAGPAWARPVRRVFQPKDLDFRPSGLAELTLQLGLVRGQQAYRVSTPGFELDVGLTPNLELDVSGEFAVGGPADGAFTFDRTSPDNTWTSLKAGLLDVATDGGVDSWTAGIQLGPQLPTARGNSGVGLEGLVLAGWRHREALLVLNLGGLLDPDPGGGKPRPAGLEGGLDFTIPVDAAGRWTLYAGVSGVRYLNYPNQMNLLSGVIWSPSERLDVSLTVLGGPAGGGDRWGVLLGFTPKARLW